MTKRMLIDASHAEETRVVLLDGSRIEDYDIEAAGRRQLKGNIYLAKVVRVEPSLQAAFIEYGGNRHGFLAFGEIHPDYYQIPVADRQRLLEMQEAEALEEEEEEERAAQAGEGAGEAASEEAGSPAELEHALQADLEGTREIMPDASRVAQATAVATEMRIAPDEVREEFPPEPSDLTDVPDAPGPDAGEALGADLAPEAAEPVPEAAQPVTVEAEPVLSEAMPSVAEEILEGSLTGEVIHSPEGGFSDGEDEDAAGEADGDAPAEQAGDTRPAPELVGGEGDERRERRAPPRFLRNYKIQEVIRRRQILLVQVVKEERGTKGAALTTYISLAGRFSVLMPNSPRGGGVSRKITSAADRRRLKEVMTELGLPRGMGLIVRTAGANRPKAEIMRDCEYLLNQWDQIRDLTMRSIAPALIYEEANLIKRAMRDLYSREVEEVLVEGDQGWKAARDFMRMLMPDAARKVQLWREGQPLFTKANVEQQLDAMLAPTVQLRSGGYLVIDQAEALVAIDVNSGRSTRERGIEGTALRTNLEAAEEVARQLRLRDLAGLIVIDFIDMESRRHNAMVERRLKEALRNDRARIQVGSISHFGLLEMSRQRLRPSLTETNFVPCPHCGGLGHVRSIESCALHVLRTIEEEGARRRAAEILVHCAAEVALFLLNHKRPRLGEIEARFTMRVAFAADATLLGAQVRIDRIRTQQVLEAPMPVSQVAPEIEEDEEEPVAEAEAKPEAEAATAPDATGDDADQRRRRRRRRSRSRGRAETDAVSPDEMADDVPVLAEATDDATSEEVEIEVAAAEPVEALADEPPVIDAVAADPPAVEQPAEAVAEPEPASVPAAEESVEDKGEEPARKRRGRRGGRRRRREDEVEAPAPDAEVAAEVPVYVGPTPADPFGGAYDIFDALERAEEERAAARVDATPEPSAEPAPEATITAEARDVGETLVQHATVEADAPAEPTLAPGTAHTDAAEPTRDDDEAEEQPTLPALTASDDTTPGSIDAEPEPTIVPVLVGADETPAVPKRGWWRR